MRLSPATALRVLGIAAVGALYYWLSHIVTAADRPSSAGALLSLGPYMAVALVVAWRARHRAVAVGIWLLAIIALASQWTFLKGNFAWIYLIQHAGTFTLLAIGFGRTLGKDATPMISGFAERVHGPLPPALARYTRGATLAWTLFFGAMAVTSLVLFFLAPIDWWSAYANLLTPGLIGTMFLAEFLARQRLPRECRTGLVASIRACLAPQRPKAGGDCDIPSANATAR